MLSGDLSKVVAGETSVLIGTLLILKRDQAQVLVKTAGGRAPGSVSKKTDYVAAGEAASSKLKKANASGVVVLSEGGLLELLGKDVGETV